MVQWEVGKEGITKLTAFRFNNVEGDVSKQVFES
jgi:hypothetical protein